MEQHGNSMTDTAPLVRLKNALAKLKEEISQFDVRIGVVENTLLLVKVRSKQ
jgi:estrogen-related receptor beta like 1